MHSLEDEVSASCCVHAALLLTPTTAQHIIIPAAFSILRLPDTRVHIRDKTYFVMFFSPSRVRVCACVCVCVFECACACLSLCIIVCEGQSVYVFTIRTRKETDRPTNRETEFVIKIDFDRQTDWRPNQKTWPEIVLQRFSCTMHLRFRKRG